MKKIIIIGAGAMGSAFTVPCVENNNRVTLVGTHLEDKLIEKLQKNRIHPALNSYIPKKVKLMKFENFKEEYKSNPDYIVLAVSSKGIEWVSNQLIRDYSKKLSIILLTKGLTIINKKISTIPKQINLLFKKQNLPKQNITSIKGPCLANGLINKVRTNTVIANEKISKAIKISKIISTDYYKTEISNDIIGVEVAGAIKNIYSMIIGASKGLSGNNIDADIRKNYYHNTASTLFKNSLSEMKKFVKIMGGRSETAYGLAGLGDLYVSVAGGRNSLMGTYLGQGKFYKEVQEKIMKNVTVEGADLALDIGTRIFKDFKKKDFPIMYALIKSIIKNKKLKISW